MFEKSHCIAVMKKMCKGCLMVSILMFSIYFIACSNIHSAQNNTPQQNKIYLNTGKTNNIHEISMEDAINIGMNEAEKYYSNLQLTEVHSYDNDKIPSETAGSDGKRELWYVTFANNELNNVCILINCGNIEIVKNFDHAGNSRLLNLDNVHMTSDEAVKKAKDMGLKGGNPNNPEEWISGYNFKMSLGTLTSSPNDTKIFLEVIGISPNGNFAHIDFNASTGEIILCEEKFEYPDGSIEWKEF